MQSGQVRYVVKYKVKKNGYRSVKTHWYYTLLLMWTTKTAEFVYKQRPFYVTYMDFYWCSSLISSLILLPIALTRLLE